MKYLEWYCHERALEAASIHEYMITIRRQMTADGVVEVVDNDSLRFTKEYIFPSPSQAAAIVLARTANGWVEWKYPNGRTLDELKRK